MAVLLNGGPWPIVGLVVIGGLAVGLWMEPYLRELMGDGAEQKWTGRPPDKSKSMFMLARRVGIAIGSFVIAWLVVSLIAEWLFGSGNVVVWVLAAIVGAGVYLEVLRRDRRLGSSDAGVAPRPRDI